MTAPSALNSKQTVISPLNGGNPSTEITSLFWNHFEKFDSMARVRIKNRLTVCLILISFALTQVMFQEGIQTLGAGSFRFCAK